MKKRSIIKDIFGCDGFFKSDLDRVQFETKCIFLLERLVHTMKYETKPHTSHVIAEIFVKYYGLDGSEKMTLKSISKQVMNGQTKKPGINYACVKSRQRRGVRLLYKYSKHLVRHIVCHCENCGVKSFEDRVRLDDYNIRMFKEGLQPNIQMSNCNSQ